MTSGGSTTSSSVSLPVTALIDAVAITVFVLIGRSSHHNGYALLGVLQTLWPFLAGAAVGWSIDYVYSHVRSREWFGREFRPDRIVPAGLFIWFCTVTVGMILRYLFHEGVAVSFIIVAATVLALFLLGWRALAAFVVRRNA
ncbi:MULTISPECIES: DUF3054 domain-containing protein [Gordonia]|uniref:DUF3054 domain-containing protein n=1 Tax=Gordonia TaxID=2053 RepID=UPI000AE1A3CB|nr:MULTISPECIES: DUF3054 domain-containing protein [Gordonia]WLP88912.1 DUF3054 domain-containing protein [Gordonia sp. NB41Y]